MSKDLWKIIFSNSDLNFCGGDFVSGTVFWSKTNIAYSEIRLEIIGQASVDFREPDKFFDIDNFKNPLKNEIVETIFYTTCILAENKLREKEVGNSEIEFPFSLRLAQELPGSTTVSRGHIKYEVKVLATMMQPNLDDQYKTASSNVLVISKEICVLAGLDLSFLPEAATKLDVCKFRELGLFCFDGTVLFKWHVDVSGYIAGDVIVVTETIDNESGRKVNKQDIILYKITSYSHLRKRLKDREIIAHAMLVSFVLTESISTRILNITLPANLPPTGLGRCRMIDISYELEFTAEVIGPCGLPSKIRVVREIYIGTVPLILSELASYISVTHNQHDLVQKFAHKQLKSSHTSDTFAPRSSAYFVRSVGEERGLMDECLKEVEDRPPPYVPLQL